MATILSVFILTIALIGFGLEFINIRNLLRVKKRNGFTLLVLDINKRGIPWKHQD